MRVALYKAYAPGHAWWSFLVDLASGGGGYTHAELVFSDGVCFSSSGMDPAPGMGGKPGLRFSRLDFSDHPERWDFFTVWADGLDEQKVRDWCEAEVAHGYGYDWGAVLRFIIPFVGESSTKYMCSEAVVEALRQCGIFPPPPASYKISPNGLAKMLGR